MTLIYQMPPSSVNSLPWAAAGSPGARRIGAVARVFVTRPFPEDAVSRLRERHEVHVWQNAEPPTREEIVAGAQDGAGLLCMPSDRIDAALMDACAQLRVIATYAVGFDNIDVAAASARGIAVGNTPDVLTDATADVAFGLLVAVARRLVEGDRVVRAGTWRDWRPDWMLGADVSGTTLGIIGYGKIGQAMARRARGFDMEVLWTSSSGGTPLDELLGAADHVSLHCPLTPATHHLISERALRTMKNTATLVNTARGAVVDPHALRRALESGEIAAAGLDVTDPEPLAPTDPLLAAPNLVITPHIASASVRARARMADLAVENLLCGLADEPLPHPVLAPAPRR